MMRYLAVLALLAAATAGVACAVAPPDAAASRRALVAELRALTRGGPRELSEPVLEAIGRVPRHLFVPESLRSRAYENRPLRIGHGQTISQPYIVALMTQLSGAGKGDRVLEVGTGSGYQAAVLAQLGAQVHSIEIVEALAASARERLARLGYAVEVIAGDGYAGLESRAPFDAILVTAAPDHVPSALVRQLKPGGRLVIPVGPVANVQELLLIEKDAQGRVSRRSIVPVRFVPLTRK